MSRHTWCADKDCVTVVDLDDDPPNDENGEARCDDHTPQGRR